MIATNACTLVLFLFWWFYCLEELQGNVVLLQKLQQWLHRYLIKIKTKVEQGSR